MKPISLRPVRMWACVLLLALIQSIRCYALTLVGDPRFIPSINAPLAGTLQVATDLPSRVSVAVTDGIESWSRNFFDYGTNHVVPLYGFRPDRTNQITVTLRDAAQNEVTAPNPLPFTTDPLPDGFPVINVLVSKPELMEPGYNLFRAVNIQQTVGYIAIVNNAGEVVWYSTVTAGSDVKQLANGDLFTPTSSELNEIDLLGDVVKEWTAIDGYYVDSHEAISTPRHTFLYISPAEGSLLGFPSNLNIPPAANDDVDVLYNYIVEMSAEDSSIVNTWSLFDLLDPNRYTYLTYTKTQTGQDTEHTNAILEDPRDGTIIVSVRNQNAVVKFNRTTGQLKWILGPHDGWSSKFAPNLLTPVGTPFEWNYAQHAPVYTPQGTLLLYDDGNFRAMPPNTPVSDSQNYSRAVEYKIDEEAMTVQQVWEYGENVSEPLYTGSVGSAYLLPQTDHVLITFGNVSYIDHHRPSLVVTNASMARIKEVTHDANPQVVFDLELFDANNTDPDYRGYYVYRTYRIPDLYAHPLTPVTDLVTFIEKGFAHLTFSADPVHSYMIESSSDLAHWTEVAMAELDAQGMCHFLDEDSENASTRFYRIETR